ncbi:hypothetical protein AVEN_241698-1 [Araneus ventricosus]|uniref:Uncharacterized protein n=1 Tax=Araneus ventricosus TaxID=182803 RepID=A0A4Y2FUB0_ARAVE|nr:hypothetical protein AVEN_241698-1 [Araneus ventricosus]
MPMIRIVTSYAISLTCDLRTHLHVLTVYLYGKHIQRFRETVFQRLDLCWVDTITGSIGLGLKIVIARRHHLSQGPHSFCTKECNSFRLSGGFQNQQKILEYLRLDFAPKSYRFPIARGFVRWLQHSGETSVIDRKVKGSGLDRDFSTVPTGSGNCVCVLGQYSTTRCSAGRITTAINPQNMGLGYRSISFHCFRTAYYRERDLFFSPALSGGPNCLLFKGPTCHRASWQPRQSATDDWLQWRSSRVLNKLLSSATKSRYQSTAGRRGHTQKGKPARE